MLLLEEKSDVLLSAEGLFSAVVLSGSGQLP